MIGCGMHDVRSDRHVFIEKVSLVCAVCVNTTHFGSGNNGVVRPLGCKEIFDSFLFEQIQLSASPNDQVAISIALESSDDSRAHQTSVSRNKNSAFRRHQITTLSDEADAPLARRSRRASSTSASTIRSISCVKV